MQRFVSIRRSRKTGCFVINPMCTFLGFGAPVDSSPYRELPGNCSSKALGRALAEILELAGSTGVKWAQFQAFEKQRADARSVRVRNKYFPTRSSESSEQVARKFHLAKLTQKHARKSWQLQRLQLDKEQRWLVHDIEVFRIAHSAGVAALGTAVHTILTAEV